MSCSGDCGPIIVTLLTGAPGVQGAQGVQGIQGPQGQEGPQGPPGSVGTVTGDISIDTEGVATLATVGTAATTGGANKALTVQRDAKGRVLSVTQEAISITTSQVQNLSLETLGGVAITDPRLTDARTPTGAAGGDLTGTFPNPTLAATGTAGTFGAASKSLTVQTDAKGRVAGVTAQPISITTSQVQNLSIETLGGVATTDPRLTDSRTPTGAAGGDLAGTYPNPTLGTVGTAKDAVGSATFVPVVSIDAKGRVTALTSVQISALTTAQLAGLATATPAAIATAGAVGVELFAARADHVHALATLGEAGTFGSGTLVPVLTVDAFGRVASITPTPISGGGGGVSLTTAVASPLGALASVGISEFAAHGDHVHPLPTPAQVGAIATTGTVKLSINTSGAGTAGINLTPLASAPGSPTAGDVWISGNQLQFQGASSSITVPGTSSNNTLTGTNAFANRVTVGAGSGTALTVSANNAVSASVIVSGSTNSGVPLARITQTGAGDALVVEDSTNPDSTVFSVNSGGRVGIGVGSISGAETAALTVDSGGIKFSDGSLQTAAVAAVVTTGLAPLASPAFTGAPTAPTAAVGTNTTQLATTAFVLGNAGDKYRTTSTTTATISNGTKTFTVASGLSYTATQDVTIVADVDNHMHATVTSYSGTTLVVDVTNHTGTGTFSSWTINVGGLTTAAGALLATNNLSDVANTTTARTNIGAVGTGRSINTGTGLSGGGDLTADRTLDLATSGVVAGVYGSASGVPVLTVDAYGRLTSVTTTQLASLTTNEIAGLSTSAPGSVATAGVVGTSLFAARADHTHKVATVYARTKTVGVDAATIQGCIDLITDASATNQAQVLVPPGVYAENLTLKPCVSVVASGGNNGQTSTVRITGNATFTGGATAADNTLQLIGLSLNTTHATTPALTVAASGGVTVLLHVKDCMLTSSNAASTAVCAAVGTNCSLRLLNSRTQGNTTASQGGTHIDLDGGSFYGENWTCEYGTRALLLRGTNGALKPYAELKWSNLSVSGANVIEITSATALLTMGWTSIGNLAATGNGVTVAAGSVVGASQCVFAVQAGASNYVVTGSAGSYYYSLGNSYSNATGAPYETKIGASVTQFQYARSYDPAGGDLTGSFPNPTLATVGTAKNAYGSATFSPVVTIDAKGRVTALTSVQISALTTAQLSGLSTATPATVTTAGVVGTSLFAARSDHAHALATVGTAGTFGDSSVVPIITLDEFGRVTALSTTPVSGGGGGVSLTTADAAPLGAVASAGVSTLAARGDHIHPLPTAAQIGALTTTQILGLSTATPAVLTTTGVVGVSTYAARADHSHALTTSGTANLFSASSPSALGSTASAGTASTVARSDHRHIYPTPAQIGAIATTGTVPLSIDTTALNVPPLRITPQNSPNLSGFGQIFLDSYSSPYLLKFVSDNRTEVVATQTQSNTFQKSQTIYPSDTVNPALKIIQTTTADCLRVEDSTSPDATPFVIDNAGRVGIGVAPDSVAAITVDGGGVKIANAGATTFCNVTVGAGSPEGVVTAGPGSLYLNTSGGSGTTLYVKESGAGNTGWVGK